MNIIAMESWFRFIWRYVRPGRLFLLLMFFALTKESLFAQVSKQYIVFGRVVDEAQNPIPMASVRLMNVASDKMITGETTGDDGAFRLEFDTRGKEVRLEVRFVGYVSLERKLVLSGTRQDLGILILREDERQLREVTIVAKATEVVVRGDTIEYNAGSYIVGEGDAVEALLKKLPGAEINDAGEIVINGKTVTKVMVDGKRFFESDPKVALKNLSAELIDKIQVLDRESDNTRMTGFADGQEETIINLTVKKGKKRGLFGSAYVGAGTDKRYEVNASLNRFVDGNQWTLMAGLNNTNNVSFTDIGSDVSQSDLVGQVNALGRGRGRGGASSLQIGGITSSSLVGGNMARTFDLLELSGGTFWGATDRVRQSKAHATNFYSWGSTIEETTTSERNRKNTFGANLRFQWKPSSSTEIILTPQLNWGLSSGRYWTEALNTTAEGSSPLNSQSLNQTLGGRVLRSEIRAEASHRLRGGRTFAAFVQWSYDGDETEGVYRSVLNNGTDTSIIDQSLKGIERQWGARTRLSYVEPLVRGYALQLQYQISLDWTIGSREAYDYDPITEQHSLHSTQYSHLVRSSFLAHRAGIALKRLGVGYDITAGINLDPSMLYAYMQRDGRDVMVEQKALNYSPTLRIKYKPSAALDFGLDYRGRSFQPTSRQLAPVEDVTSQTIVYQGNPNLSAGYRHNLFGRLSLFDAPRKSSLMFFAHFQYIQNGIVPNSTYSSNRGIRYVSYTNVDGNGRLGLGGFYSRPIFRNQLTARISTQNNLSRQIGFLEGVKNVAHILRLSESFALAYRLGWLDMSLKGTWSYYTLINSDVLAVRQTTQDYQVDWDSKLIFGRWNIDLSAVYRTSIGYLAAFDKEQLLINTGVSVSFCKERAATLRLKVYDLLAQQQSISRRVSALSDTTEESNMLGRYLMLHFIYRFNHLGAKEAYKSKGRTSVASDHRPRTIF